MLPDDDSVAPSPSGESSPRATQIFGHGFPPDSEERAIQTWLTSLGVIGISSIEEERGGPDCVFAVGFDDRGDSLPLSPHLKDTREWQ